MDYAWFSARYRVAMRRVGTDSQHIRDSWDALAFALCMYPGMDTLPPWAVRR